MAAVAVQQPGLGGAAVTYQAAAGGGDTFQNDGATVLHIKNGSGAGITVTINSVAPCDQGFDHDIVVVVPAAGERWIGPFDVYRFGYNPTVTYSGVTTLTLAAVKVR